MECKLGLKVQHAKPHLHTEDTNARNMPNISYLSPQYKCLPYQQRDRLDVAPKHILGAMYIKI